MSRNKDNLGDRMKRYEAASDVLLPRRMPIIIRADGQAFHTYTRGFNRPFDERVIGAMQYASTKTAESMCGFKLAFIQSDEASFLLTDYDDIATQAWFDNSLLKLCTITASWMTVHFNQYMRENLPEKTSAERKLKTKIATFDARAFAMPEADVANYFLWRAKDWERNSVSMYCRSFFSAKEMHGKGRADQHELLHTVGKNWTKDLSPQIRNGTWLYKLPDQNVKASYKTLPKYAAVSELVGQVLPQEVAA